MQVCDPIYNHPSLNNNKNLLDHSTMSNQPSTPIPEDKLLLSSEQPNPQSTDTTNPNSNFENGGVTLRRSNRPLRACTARAAARLYSAAAPVVERKPKQVKRERKVEEVEEEQEEEESSDQQCNGKIVTPLVTLPVPPALLPRWGLRSMWELASVLNFLNVFRPLLNINAEFSVEELETALLTPNATLSDIHIPLLKAIPPVTRMALGRATWVTVLCRKLRDWWHWVAEGDLPIVASHGTEVDAYNALEPAVRVIILKALCDIRVEQEDIRSYIDSSIKHGVHLSTFRKDRVGGDSHGISYWYEDDPIIGHRLYRQIRTVDVKKVKGKGSQMLPCATYHWETVATNFDEFQDVSEKLFSSKNRTEASLGKKLKNDMLPEIEKVHKKKERLLKKQHREALLLDNYFNMDELGPGRSLRDRKPVTYTFDDFDRSINEAIKITRNKPSSPEPSYRREGAKPEASLNGRLSSHSQVPNAMFSSLSPQSPDYDERDDDEHKSEQLERSNRRRQRPQRYSGKEFVEALSENEADFESDDDIVGEVVYDEEYLKKRKQRHKSSSSEGDEEYNWDAENGEDDEEEEEEEEDYSSNSDDSDQPRRVKKLPGRTRNETKSRSVNALQLGLRRSKRATRNRINYRKYDGSDSETESMKPQKRKIASDRNSDVNDDKNEQSDESSEDNEPMEVEQQAEDPPEPVKQEQNQSPEKSNRPNEDEVEGVQHRRFLDLNELAPGSGFDDGPNTIQDKDTGMNRPVREDFLPWPDPRKYPT